MNVALPRFAVGGNEVEKCKVILYKCFRGKHFIETSVEIKFLFGYFFLFNKLIEV